jgi:hypothetical protein
MRIAVVALGIVALATTEGAAQAKQTAPSGSAVQQVDDADSLGSWRASKLIGTDVKDAAGQGIGKIEDVILEPGGRSPMVVMSFGGFLGLGEKLFAVPWSAMRLVRDDRDNVVVMLDNVKKETLEKAPSFPRDRWPDARDRRWGAESSRYWSDTSITSAVKTRLVREEKGALTKVDVDTEKGVVHLTGTVTNDAMKRRATDLARTVDGVRDVKNDLRVQSGG